MYILLVRDKSKKLRITSNLKQMYSSLMYYKTLTQASKKERKKERKKETSLPKILYLILLIAL